MTATAKDEALAGLAAALHCSQCGGPFDGHACGITHALIAGDPRTHRLLAPVIEAERTEARAEALREAGQLVRDHLFGQVDAERVASFLDSRAARLDPAGATS